MKIEDLYFERDLENFLAKHPQVNGIMAKIDSGMFTEDLWESA